MLQRHRFDIVTPTVGAFTDSGEVYGAIMQITYKNTDLDTGCGIKLEFPNSGFVIFENDNMGGSDRTWAPRILSYDTGNAAVGDQYPVAAGEMMKITVQDTGTGAAGGTTGTVFVVTGW